MTAELKNNLSRYLDHVKQGGEVLVLDRNRPVARIVPVHAGAHGGLDEERLLRLEQRGFVRRGAGGVPASLRKRRRPTVRGGLLADILADRRSGW